MKNFVRWAKPNGIIIIKVLMLILWGVILLVLRRTGSIYFIIALSWEKRMQAPSVMALILHTTIQLFHAAACAISVTIETTILYLR